MKRVLRISIVSALVMLSFSFVSGQQHFTVEVKGKGKPMILVPGLYCNGEVWKETVEHYKDRYECHIITLAGFGGNAPQLSDHFLASVNDDLITYVKAKKLKKPVIMGHSLGAFLAYYAAESAPGLFDKVIAVDGAPFMAALAMPNATAESSKPMATNIKKGMEGQTPEQIFESQKQYLPNMITSPERVLQVANIAKTADSNTQAEVMYELFTTDLRKNAAMIDCPVLVLGAWIAYKDYGASHETTLKNYKDQLAGVKDLQVEIHDTAKHFIFYDDQVWFFEKVDGFLGRK